MPPQPEKVSHKSAAVVEQQVVELRKLYPAAFTEGKVDFGKLRQLLGDDVAEGVERFGLSWSGKSDAIKAIQTLTTATLLPARAESVNFDATENLIIEGDNLEALKLLQGGYHGRVKMIYIDPPYNTGGEFILGLVEFREDHSKPPFRKAHIRPVPNELEAGTEWAEGDEEDEGFATQVRSSYFYKQSQVSVKYLRDLLGGKIFNNPKDHEEIARLIKYVMGSDTSGIILDFFAGSGTTAQAVLELNAQDGGNRKFILVQLPEPTERKDFFTIAEITKERVRRVIKKLAHAKAQRREEAAAKLQLGDLAAWREADLGFKVFKLSSSNFKVWDAASTPKDAAGLAEQLKLIASNVEEGRAEDALLYELILRSNLPLTSRVVAGKIGEQVFYDVADGTLAICLEKKITPATLRGIMALKPKGVICLDTAFAGNDQLKTNTVLEMKSHQIEFHTA